jgi:hypothetical protein
MKMAAGEGRPAQRVEAGGRLKTLSFLAGA